MFGGFIQFQAVIHLLNLFITSIYLFPLTCFYHFHKVKVFLVPDCILLGLMFFLTLF